MRINRMEQEKVEKFMFYLETLKTIEMLKISKERKDEFYNEILLELYVYGNKNKKFLELYPEFHKVLRDKARGYIRSPFVTKVVKQEVRKFLKGAKGKHKTHKKKRQTDS
jgi:hypothetical protein